MVDTPDQGYPGWETPSKITHIPGNITQNKIYQGFIIQNKNNHVQVTQGLPRVKLPNVKLPRVKSHKVRLLRAR